MNIMNESESGAKIAYERSRAAGESDTSYAHQLFWNHCSGSSLYSYG